MVKAGQLSSIMHFIKVHSISQSTTDIVIHVSTHWYHYGCDERPIHEQVHTNSHLNIMCMLFFLIHGAILPTINSLVGVGAGLDGMLDWMEYKGNAPMLCCKETCDPFPSALYAVFPSTLYAGFEYPVN